MSGNTEITYVLQLPILRESMIDFQWKAIEGMNKLGKAIRSKEVGVYSLQNSFLNEDSVFSFEFFGSHGHTFVYFYEIELERKYFNGIVEKLDVAPWSTNDLSQGIFRALETLGGESKYTTNGVTLRY